MATTQKKSFSINPNFSNTVVFPQPDYNIGLQNAINKVFNVDFAKNPIEFYQDILSLALTYTGLGETNFSLLPEELASGFRGQYSQILNTVLLNKNIIKDSARLGESVAVISHEVRHKYQYDSNYLHKMFSSSNNQFITGSLSSISKLLGYEKESVEQALYPCSKVEYDAFINGFGFAKDFMQSVVDVAKQYNLPLQDYVQTQLEIVDKMHNYNLAVTSKGIKDIITQRIPTLYQRANENFNNYLEIAKACQNNQPLTNEQQSTLNKLTTFNLAGKNEQPFIHNLVGMTKLLSFCPVRENVKAFVDYLRDSNDDGAVYQQGMQLLKIYNIPITQSDFTKLMLKCDFYQNVKGNPGRFIVGSDFLVGIDETVLIQNLLVTQGKPLVQDMIGFFHRLENDGRINGLGQNHLNFDVLDRYIENYSNNPLIVFNGQSIYGCSELLDSVFALYIQNNPPKSAEEKNEIYNAMSDNLSNIIGHFPNFSPDNKQLNYSLQKFTANPFEKQFEDKLEYINQASSSLAPELSQAMGRYADSQNPSVVENNATYIAQHGQAQQDTSSTDQINENDIEELDAKEVEQLLNDSFNALAQAITGLCQVLTALTEVLNSPIIQEVFANAGVEAKVESNLEEKILGTTSDKKIEELRESPFEETEVDPNQSETNQTSGETQNANSDGFMLEKSTPNAENSGVELKTEETSLGNGQIVQPEPVVEEAVVCAPELN